MVCWPLATCFALALLARSAAAAAPDGGTAVVAPAVLAANAAAYLRFRNAAALTRQRLDEMRVTTALLAGREDARKALGADVLDLGALAAVATDPQREILVGWGIAEAREVEVIMAAADPPVGAFTIRFVVTLPVSDLQEAPAGLAQMLAVPACAPVSADRKHPAAPDRVVYRCATERAALSVRLDRNRRELHWIVALGSRAAAAAAVPVEVAPPALSARLLGEGFFDGDAAFFTTPADLVRGGIAMGLTQMLAVFSELAAATTAKRAIWQQGVKELGSIARLADSGPRMFSSLLVTERGRQWGLTAEGETVLASLGLPGSRREAGGAPTGGARTTHEARGSVRGRHRSAYPHRHGSGSTGLCRHRRIRLAARARVLGASS